MVEELSTEAQPLLVRRRHVVGRREECSGRRPDRRPHRRPGRRPHRRPGRPRRCSCRLALPCLWGPVVLSSSTILIETPVPSFSPPPLLSPFSPPPPLPLFFPAPLSPPLFSPPPPPRPFPDTNYQSGAKRASEMQVSFQSRHRGTRADSSAALPPFILSMEKCMK